MMSWFQREIIDNGRLALFLGFVAFVVTFLATRVIVRLIRAGRGPFKNNVSEGGLHIHHAIPGLILLVAGAFIAVGVGSQAPWAEIAGILVGVGTSLVLDEFALILHLDDVYWAEEGRISFDMISLAFASVGLFLIGANPFDVGGDDGSLPAAVRVAILVAAVLVHLTLIVICVAKGKYKLALLGIFVPILVDVGALRLARPASRWAKKRYGPDKMQRAIRRAGNFDARFGKFTNWVGDVVAGRPTLEPEPAPH